MRRIYLIGMLSMALVSMAAEQKTKPTTVSGKVQVGTVINVSQLGEETNFLYETNDARLGSNSGNQYGSQANYKSNNAKMVYGADMKVKIKERHQLGITVEGKHDWKQTKGTRTETINDRNDTEISRVSGTYNHPRDRMNDVLAGVNYCYHLPREGDSLKMGYRYHWNNTTWGLEQQISERTGWALYSTNTLVQQISKQTHRAWMDYVCRIAKGHAMDIGVAYDRRQIDGHTQQDWDQHCHLNADYQHLTQYGVLYARYRMAIGPVKASAGLEYRATKMQQRWLHDVVPTAMVRWQVDSVHALTGGYRMLLIRPEYNHLDTNKIRDAYTLSFGNNALVGTHVHNTNLMYQMSLKKVTFSADLRYLTAKDGLNALWMERNNVRTYTWGNEGIRHAVSLTPKVNSRLGETTRLVVAATILWDERIAKAINMSNDNWGISTNLSLEQRLPYAMAISVHGDYAYHNTLDLYSFADHGGQVGADWKMALLKQHNLTLKVGYACRFIPDIVITQGGWTGRLAYQPRCVHLAELLIGYRF